MINLLPDGFSDCKFDNDDHKRNAIGDFLKAYGDKLPDDTIHNAVNKPQYFDNFKYLPVVWKEKEWDTNAR